jgi:hypothetical protein
VEYPVIECWSLFFCVGVFGCGWGIELEGSCGSRRVAGGHAGACVFNDGVGVKFVVVPVAGVVFFT